MGSLKARPLATLSNVREFNKMVPFVVDIEKVGIECCLKNASQHDNSFGCSVKESSIDPVQKIEGAVKT